MLGRGRIGGLVLLLVAVAVLVVLVVAEDHDLTAAERNSAAAADQAPVRDGNIVHSRFEPGWPERFPLRLTGAGPFPSWEAFDQETGSFLFVDKFGRARVVGEDGLRSQSRCDDLWPACDLITFGPGPDELTVPVDEPGGLNFLQSAQVRALDGTVRDTLDLSAAVTSGATGQPQQLADLAWSPDGSRLAVSIEPEFGCDPRRFPCEGQVWLFDRDGGRPRLVFTERASGELIEGEHPNLPVLRELAWSPRGHSLAMVVAGSMLGHVAEMGAYPRLIALRLLLGRRVRTDTLHVYDDREYHVGPGEYDLEFAFAWSPRGSRIAVLTKGGIAEISAGDGRLLARHPGELAQGPLAWLREG